VCCFVPYALADHDAYTSRLAAALGAFGVEVTGVHAVPTPVAAARQAAMVFVGGGNAFRLLRALQRLGLSWRRTTSPSSGSAKGHGSVNAQRRPA
jgi:peptidase E